MASLSRFKYLRLSEVLVRKGNNDEETCHRGGENPRRAAASADFANVQGALEHDHDHDYDRDCAQLISFRVPYP